MKNFNRRFFLKGVSISFLPLVKTAYSSDASINQLSINKQDVFLIIDMQYDFCPGGSLAVKDGDSIIPRINTIQKRFENIILSQDWHPKEHSSFFSSHEGKEPFSTIKMPYGEQTLWPPHCIMGTKGAEFHKELEVSNVRMIVRKGFRKEIDSYSAFWENDKTTPTGLDGALKTMGIKRVFICGLALDFCVAYSAIDSVIAGYDTFVIEDISKPVNLPGSIEATYKAFDKYGIKRILST